MDSSRDRPFSRIDTMRWSSTFSFPTSQLLKRLETETIYKLDLEDEVNNMYHFFSVMVDPSGIIDMKNVRFLNLEMLSSYELPGQQTIDSKFYPTHVLTFTKVLTLRLGKVCLDQQKGKDERGKVDVD